MVVVSSHICLHHPTLRCRTRHSWQSVHNGVSHSLIYSARSLHAVVAGRDLGTRDTAEGKQEHSHPGGGETMNKHTLKGKLGDKLISLNHSEPRN